MGMQLSTHMATPGMIAHTTGIPSKQVALCCRLGGGGAGGQHSKCPDSGGTRSSHALVTRDYVSNCMQAHKKNERGQRTSGRLWSGRQ